MSNTNTPEYGGAQIQVLKGLEAVRVRPAMYIGDTDKKGYHHLVWETLDNAVDEAMAGHCNTIHVSIEEDGNTISVEDNGRGIPVEPHPTEKKSTLEVVLCTLHAGGKFGGSGYEASGGLHGVGVSCVNALAEYMEVTVWRNDKSDKENFGEWHMELSRGNVTKKVTRSTTERIMKRGTRVTFRPDHEIFKEIHEFDENTIIARIKETAFLNAGLKIIYSNKKTGRKEEFHAEGGISDYVEYLNKPRLGKYPAPPIYAEKFSTLNGGRFQMQLAVQFAQDGTDTVLSFANNIKTTEGGRHLTGFQMALTRVVNLFARNMGLLKEKESNLAGEDIQDGITSIISVRLPQPQFEGQTKTKLGTAEVQGLVQTLAGEALTDYFDKNPTVIKKIVEKSISIRKAREASKKVFDAVKRDNGFSNFGMPDKLDDCQSTDVENTELFIVEGDSAAGSAKGGRDPKYQAVMPIRGKLANPEKNDIAKMMANEEIKALIHAIGVGILDNLDMTKLRYGKIIIMTDADDDGAHILCLLLTFFYRFMKPLIEEGRVYVALPPLYRGTVNDETVGYAYTLEELDALRKTTKSKMAVTRFKGLGEMNGEELGETAMKRGVRHLLKVTMVDIDEASRMLSILMGANVQPRKEFIVERSALRAALAAATEVK